MPVQLSPNVTQVILTKVEEPQTVPASGSNASVMLYPAGENPIVLDTAQPVSVNLTQIVEASQAQIVLRGATQASTSVLLGLSGPKGDAGPPGPPGPPSGGGAIQIFSEGVLVEDLAEILDFYGPGVSVGTTTDGRVELTFTGAGDATNIYSRVNTDISGVWGATFYVQDATQAGDWIITRIDGDGVATQSSSDDSDNAGVDTSTAWTNRLSLTYA